MTQTGGRKRVAILGGGCGALSAAFWLSSTPALRERFEVTVYTQGWRLGGKGASGRSREPGEGRRIEEHGLHVMMGFYDTAFQVIRTCYRHMAMPPAPAFADWDQAFTPQSQITLWLRPGIAGLTEWTPWNLEIEPPTRAGAPGDGPLSLALDAGNIFQGAAEFLDRMIRQSLEPIQAMLAEQSPANGDLLQEYRARLDALRPFAQPLVNVFDPGQARSLLAALRDLQTLFLGRVIAAIEQQAQVEMFALRLEWYKRQLLARLGFAGMTGFLADVVLGGSDALARLNRIDFKAWLRKHHAGDAAESCLVMGLYDLAFAYVDGDASSPDHGQGAAGTCLAMILRMAFGFRGAPLWKMGAGMGEVIFTPLFRLLDTDQGSLASRGVHFEFFNRVKQLRRSSADPAQIDGIEIDLQANLPAGTYRPLFDVAFDGYPGKTWDCWPAAPDWGQLQDGERIRDLGIDFEDLGEPFHVGKRTLRRGVDFDAVILAIPPKAAEALTQDLAADARWRRMLDEAHSVMTQSVQLWLEPGLADLGWKDGATVATCYAGSLRSWGEMSQVLASEAWAGEAKVPKSCQYLCGTFHEREHLHPPEAPLPERHLAMTREWLRDYSGGLWPQATDGGGGLDPALVVSEYVRLNEDPSELYVQSLPGTIDARLLPGDSGFANLYLAGDWTVTTLNGGCAEAAFESGLRAACAVAGLAQPPVPDFAQP